MSNLGGVDGSPRRLRPIDLVSEAHLDEAISEWRQDRERNRKNPWLEDRLQVVRRLALELIIPSFSENLGTEMRWLIKGSNESKKYGEIMEGLEGHARMATSKAAMAISMHLSERLLSDHTRKLSEDLGNRSVPGDPEHTDPRRGLAGIRGGTDPSWMDPTSNRKGLGYIQSDPKDD